MTAPRRPSRPSSSTVQGRKYQIKWLKPGSIRSENGEELWGETDHSAQMMRIERGLHPDKERVIVFHETFHQIIGQVGGPLGLSEKQEEAICTLFGESLLGHIRENPAYWRYMLRKVA